MPKLKPGIHFPTIKGVRRKVKVLASGKWKFMKMVRKGKAKKSKSRTTKSKTKTKSKRSGKKTGKKKRRRSSGFSTNKIFKWIRFGALVAPAAASAMGPGTPQDKIEGAISLYTGYHPRYGDFRFDRLAKGWGPYLGAVLATYGIPKLASILRRL